MRTPLCTLVAILALLPPPPADEGRPRTRATSASARSLTGREGCHRRPHWLSDRVRPRTRRPSLWARYTCDELLADTPPTSWEAPSNPRTVDGGPLRRQAIVTLEETPSASPSPDGSVSQTADASADDAPVPNPARAHIPIHSLLAERIVRAEWPSWSDRDVRLQGRAWVESLDQCIAGAPAAGPARRVESRHEANLSLMRGTEDLMAGRPIPPVTPPGPRRRLHIRTYLDRIEVERRRAEQFCCGPQGEGPALCHEFFRRTPVIPCVPVRSPWDGDRCTQGAYYNLVEFHLPADRVFRVDPTTDVFVNRISPGYIRVAPFLDRDGEPFDTLVVIRHEFGHLCSDARRNVMAFAGIPEAREEILDGQDIAARPDDPPNRRHELTPAASAVYARLWRGLGVNEDSQRCLAAAIERHTCADRRPRSLMEEAFADAFGFALTPPSEQIPRIFPDYVLGGMQDGEHLFPGTVLACLARTPRFRTAIVTAMQCRNPAATSR